MMQARKKLSLPNFFFFTKRNFDEKKSYFYISIRHASDATMCIKLPIIHRPSKTAKKHLRTEMHDVEINKLCGNSGGHVSTLYLVLQSKKCTFVDEVMK